MKTVCTKVDSEIYEQFLESSNKSGSSISEKLRSLVQNSLQFGSSYDMKQDPAAEIDKVGKEEITKDQKIEDLEYEVEELLKTEEDLRNKIKSLEQKIDSENINNILKCPDCQIQLADQGYVIITTDIWNKVKKFV